MCVFLSVKLNFSLNIQTPLSTCKRQILSKRYCLAHFFEEIQTGS